MTIPVGLCDVCHLARRILYDNRASIYPLPPRFAAVNGKEGDA